MSDDLDRAVDARIDAFRPDTMPSFAALEDRKRSRDRRRGAAAVTLSVAAVSVVALAATGLGLGAGTGMERPPSYATPDGAHSAGPTAGTKEMVTLPTSDWTPDSNSLLASVQGVVSTRRDGDKLCVVLEPLGARTVEGEFTPVIWPKDYTATASPLEVRDPTGQVVAREGHRLSFGGSGASPVDPAAPCMFGRDNAASVMQELPALEASAVAVPPTAEVPDVFEILDRCLGSAPNVERTSEFNGMSEAEVRAQPREEREDRRVVASDGECLGQDSDQQPGRVNLILEDGLVIGSAVERLRAAPEACTSARSYLTHTPEDARYPTPDEAADFYRMWQQSFDVIIAVPDVAQDGYTVATDLAGTVAVLQAGDVEMDAVKDDGGWRIVRIRTCES